MCAQVMAVLLDHFVSATAREKHKELIQEEANRLLRRGVSTFEIQNPLGPLLEDLCRFTDQVWLSKTGMVSICSPEQICTRFAKLFKI
jgi:hypothetical protein